MAKATDTAVADTTATDAATLSDAMQRIEDMEKNLAEKEKKLIAREDSLAKKDAENKEVIAGLKKEVAALNATSKTDKQAALDKQLALRNERVRVISSEYTYRKGEGEPRKLKVETAVDKNIKA